MESDPFLSVQNDVQSLLTQTRHLFSSFLRIRTLNSSSSTPSPELLQSRAELLSNLETLRADLEDLLESVKAVEKDPYAFGLDNVEVSRRKGFVRDVSGEVENMAKEISSNQSTNFGGSAGGLPNPSHFDNHIHDQFDDDDGGDAYAEFETQQQETMFREQDEQLDEISHTVGRLHGQAQVMGRELEEQAGILNDVEGVADRVGGKLQGGLKRVGQIVKANEEKWSGWCIWLLIFVLILLLILLIIV